MDKDRVEFGQYLTEAIIESGYDTPTDFARDAKINPGTVSRWIRNLERPSVRLLERAALKLRRDIREMVAVAYPEGMDQASAPIDRPTSHQLALELGRMLADGSPLTEEQRERLLIVVDHSMAPFRPYMRKRRTSGPAA